MRPAIVVALLPPLLVAQNLSKLNLEETEHLNRSMTSKGIESIIKNLPTKKATVLVASLVNSTKYFTTPWTVPRQALLSMEFSRQEYWSGSSSRGSS